MRASKQRGQNFLINELVLDEILRFGNPQPHDRLLEIGPGLGALTGRLYGIGPLRVIEIEARFCQELARKFPGLQIVNEDVRRVDFSQFGNDLVVFGNIPYSFSTDIIFHLISQRAAIRRAVLMLQREFAERLAAGPGGRDFGVISVTAQVWAEFRLGSVVSGSSFHPPARVESRIVQMSFLSEPRVPVSDPLWFRRVVQAAFSQRRRKLHNSLKSSGLFSAEQVSRALADCQIDGSRRAETLSLLEFSRLAEALRMGRDSPVSGNQEAP